MFKKELAYYFSTPIAYIVIGLFLLAISLFLWVIPGQWNVIESGYAQVDGLFQIAPWLLMFVCSALTMRLFAEERQTGTWLLLRAQPIALWKIVVGKYMAAFTLTVFALLPCIVHYFIVFYLPHVGRMLEHGNNAALELALGGGISLLVIGLCLVVSNVLRTSPILAKYLFGAKTNH